MQSSQIQEKRPMMQRQHNPFTRSVIRHPADQQECYDVYVQRGDNSISKRSDDKPFIIGVDLWFAGLSIAVREGLTPADLGKSPVHLTEGSTLDRQSWRIPMLMLVAMRYSDDKEKVLLNPTEIMNIANGLAAAGVPRIVEMLRDGDAEPIWNISTAIENMLAN